MRIIAAIVTSVLFCLSLSFIAICQSTPNLHTGTADPLTRWTAAGLNGLGNPANNYARAMVSFRNCLYAGMDSNDPEKMAELWRSVDGWSWNRVVAEGFGESNKGISSLALFDGYLYVGTDNNVFGCQIWRSATGDTGTWEKVVTNGFTNDAGVIAVCLMHTFKGNLYAGTGGGVGHAMTLWRTLDGTNWVSVSMDGFGDSNNIRVTSMSEFNGYLYIGTSNEVEGGEVWRSQTGDHGTWELVTAPGFGNPQAIYMYESTVFKGQLYMTVAVRSAAGEIWRTSNGILWEKVASGGFGNADNDEIRHLIVFNGKLFAGTRTYNGCEVWTSKDGASWILSNEKGFGNAHNRYVMSTALFKNSLYVGTWNQADGCEIWRLKSGDIHSHRPAPEPI